MCSKGAFNWNPVHPFRTLPSLGCAQDNHGPDRLFLESVLACILLNGSNLGIAVVQSSRQQLMHDFGNVAFDKMRLVPSSYVQGVQVFVSRASLNSGEPSMRDA